MKQKRMQFGNVHLDKSTTLSFLESIESENIANDYGLLDDYNIVRHWI